jgi:hypothetical protein
VHLDASGVEHFSELLEPHDALAQLLATDPRWF